MDIEERGAPTAAKEHDLLACDHKAVSFAQDRWQRERAYDDVKTYPKTLIIIPQWDFRLRTNGLESSMLIHSDLSLLKCIFHSSFKCRREMEMMKRARAQLISFPADGEDLELQNHWCSSLTASLSKFYVG